MLPAFPVLRVCPRPARDLAELRPRAETLLIRVRVPGKQAPAECCGQSQDARVFPQAYVWLEPQVPTAGLPPADDHFLQACDGDQPAARFPPRSMACECPQRLAADRSVPAGSALRSYRPAPGRPTPRTPPTCRRAGHWRCSVAAGNQSVRSDAGLGPTRQRSDGTRRSRTETVRQPIYLHLNQWPRTGGRSVPRPERCVRTSNYRVTAQSLPMRP